MSLFFSKDRKNFIAALTNSIRAFFMAMRVDFSKNLVKVKNLSETNYLLGLYHLELGNIFDAKLRLQITLYLKPSFALARYHLARVYIYNLEFELAKAELEKFLKTNPENICATHRLRYLNRENITFIPAQVIKEDFNCLAKGYENYMLNEVAYLAPDLTCQYLQEYLKEINFDWTKKYELLDLGCGSGFFGASISEKMHNFIIDGLDLSPKMLELAGQLQFSNDQQVYRNLFNNDFHDLLDVKHKYDFIAAILSFNYTLDFSVILDQLNKLCNEKTMLVITLATTNEESFFSFNHSLFIINNEQFEKILVEKNITIKRKHDLNLLKDLPGCCYFLTFN